jgi:hypothetical protein
VELEEVPGDEVRKLRCIINHLVVWELGNDQSSQSLVSLSNFYYERCFDLDLGL